MADWLIRKPQISITVHTGDSPVPVKCNLSENEVIDCDLQRVADQTKFFGQLIIQRFHFSVIDMDRQYDLKAGDRVTASFKIGTKQYAIPWCLISEVHRDENTNKLTITSYDKLKKTENMTLADLNLAAESFTVEDLLNKIKLAIAANPNLIIDGTIPNFNKVYTRSKINVEDTIALKDILVAIAEITGSVIYLDTNNQLHIKNLVTQTTAPHEITRDDYITLTNKDNRRLVKIISATELGDNLEVHTSLTGSNQVIWENPFLTLLEDNERIEIITNLLNDYGNFTIGQYDMKWFGDLSCRIGDPIRITCKDGSILNSYLLDDTISFNGALREDSQWEYQDPEDIEANPTTITDALSKTTARVDKVNQEIELSVQRVSELGNQLASILITLNGITSTVEALDRREVNNQEVTDREIEEIKKWTQIAQTAEDVQILINQAISTLGEVDHVTTTTGFTFNADGLHIQKSTSDISTTIDNDGMTIEQNGKELLIADHNGVMASDLTARNYLQIAHSRFQHYNCEGSDHRTGLFYWRGEDL